MVFNYGVVADTTKAPAVIDKTKIDNLIIFK